MALRTAEEGLVSLALALGADAHGLSPSEEALVRGIRREGPEDVEAVRAQILAGEDPLGVRLSSGRTPAARRTLGATFTPAPMRDAMLSLAPPNGPDAPARVVDAGMGTGRLLLALGARYPDAALVGVEVDPLTALLARASLAVHGLAQRTRVVVSDYTDTTLDDVPGRTLFFANPPYVRHHAIGAARKAWLAHTARAHGLPVSKLAGLHVYFFLATLVHARAGDVGVFLTPSEWLDVGYGKLVRALLAGPLGGESVHVFDAAAQAFPDALVTAAITRFTVSGASSMRFAAARDPSGALAAGREVPRAALLSAPRWSEHLRAHAPRDLDTIELGELCRVHRGAVTGSNATFITRDATLPEHVLVPCVTRARELFASGEALRDLGPLRRVVTLPEDLDSLDDVTRAAVIPFLEAARRRGVHETYVARKRRAWWSVALRPPAPILATYMARRAPAFVRNLAGAGHVNIAHGLYPRAPLSEGVLDALARYLTRATSTSAGRTYAGGLTKFEPREMERLRIPRAVLDCGCGEIADPDGRAERMNPCAVSRVHGTVRRRGSGAKGP